MKKTLPRKEEIFLRKLLLAKEVRVIKAFVLRMGFWEATEAFMRTKKRVFTVCVSEAFSFSAKVELSRESKILPIVRKQFS